MKSRFLYNVHSCALLVALEMVTSSSEGASSGEFVSQVLTLKNLICGVSSTCVDSGTF